jgi:hypothetical protein
MTHLESYGVSTDLVYTLERARLALKRMDRIVEIFTSPALDRPEVARFAAQLIRANAAQDSLKTLLRENGRLLARRVVESARRTGEHYLTRDAGEYRAMLWSAAIGGAITGLTVMVKMAVSGHGLPPFIEGVVASTNYALSFVAIHLLHGTLATKQPAMTAASLAAKLNAAHRRHKLTEFVDEVASLVRSQMAAIAGNLALVVPAALLVQSLLLLVGVGHLPDEAHARTYIDSLSVFGATPIYAAFTGVLLWLSAVIAGWFENWATYRRLPEAIAAAPRLVDRFGAERARAFAGGIERNVAALGGNIALGVLLGMTPQIATFFGLPLDVRHVTLSTGQLALASFTLGSDVFTTRPVLAGGDRHRRHRLHEPDGVVRSRARCRDPVDRCRRGLAPQAVARRGRPVAVAAPGFHPAPARRIIGSSAPFVAAVRGAVEVVNDRDGRKALLVDNADSRLCRTPAGTLVRESEREHGKRLRLHGKRHPRQAGQARPVQGQGDAGRQRRQQMRFHAAVPGARGAVPEISRQGTRDPRLSVQPVRRAGTG